LATTDTGISTLTVKSDPMGSQNLVERFVGSRFQPIGTPVRHTAAARRKDDKAVGRRHVLGPAARTLRVLV
jgi:hypothetical protein